MLPSGNDAAQSLAIYFGNLSLNSSQYPKTGKKNHSTFDANIYEEDHPDSEQSDEEIDDQI